MPSNTLLRTATPERPQSAADLVLVPAPRIRFEELFPAPVAPRAVRGEMLRRVINVLAAATGLLLTLPIMLCVAVAIKVTSAGPVIYTQPRVGLDRRAPGRPSGNHRRSVDHGGKLFQIYKFRTMYARRGGGVEAWAQPDDPRVTPLGRVLRRYRIDELPQLYNVLRGDMNIVGPRPEQPAIFAGLRAQIENYGSRQRVLPGITGWAQINQHYDSCLEDVKRKVRLDLHYISRCSAAEDLKIMALTLPVVLFKRGAW